MKLLWLFFLATAAGSALAAMGPTDAAPYVLAFQGDQTPLVEAINEAGAVAPAQRAALVRHLTANRSALDRLALMGLAPRAVRFHRTPKLPLLRQACTALAARGLLAESEGRTGAAVLDWLALFNVGRAAAWGPQRRPTRIEIVVGLGIESLGVRPLLRLARAGRLGAESRARLRAALAERARDGMPTLAFAIACERDAAKNLAPKGSEPTHGTYEERSREAARAWSLLAARYGAVISAAGSGTPVAALAAAPQGPRSPLERVLTDLSADLSTPEAVAAARAIDAREAAVAELARTTASR
jgi:hypothetical protein